MNIQLPTPGDEHLLWCILCILWYALGSCTSIAKARNLSYYTSSCFTQATEFNSRNAVLSGAGSSLAGSLSSPILSFTE